MPSEPRFIQTLIGGTVLDLKDSGHLEAVQGGGPCVLEVADYL
jgi:hypothetical protein